MKKGYVALVGAGPGEIGLLTLRAKELIESADVVIYDRLISDEILQMIPLNVKMINVGKESSRHLVAQDKINEMILSEALSGNFVVRLKGGDPFLFGRGGEELELLYQNNIPFEVVPGITSALSVPAFAGIPVTHRDFVSSVHIITGHQKENEPLKIDFDFLAKTTGTLVFLMGMASLKQITDGLISKGLDKKTPAAIIENGSRPNQRKLVADIESLYDKAVANHFKSPSIIIVGQVCKLSDQYDWFSKRPLFHEKIIVTRPKDSGGTLSKKLRELGAEVIDYPCIEIKEMEAREQLNSKISNIKTYTWLVFTSKNGVQIFFDYLRNQKKDLRILSDMKIAAIGSQTAKSLLDYGIIADYVPEIFDVEHLAQGLCEIVSSEDNILILRSAKGNEAMNELFNIKGIHFCDLAIYDTICASERNEMIAELINKSEEIYVTFTSASTVTGFMNSIDNNVEINRITGICIGSQTAKEAEKYNIKHHIAAEATIDSLIQKIAEVQNERNKA